MRSFFETEKRIADYPEADRGLSGWHGDKKLSYEERFGAFAKSFSRAIVPIPGIRFIRAIRGSILRPRYGQAISGSINVWLFPEWDINIRSVEQPV
jgi:hypothetical protein